MKVAGIDVHKKVLIVVVVDASAPEEKPARRRFVTMPSELHDGCSSKQVLDLFSDRWLQYGKADRPALLRHQHCRTEIMG
jgi:hypothetical protein